MQREEHSNQGMNQPAKKESALQKAPRGEFLAEETIIAKALGYYKNLPECHCAGSIKRERDRTMGCSVKGDRGQMWNLKANFLHEG